MFGFNWVSRLQHPFGQQHATMSELELRSGLGASAFWAWGLKSLLVLLGFLTSLVPEPNFAIRKVARWAKKASTITDNTKSEPPKAAPIRQKTLTPNTQRVAIGSSRISSNGVSPESKTKRRWEALRARAATRDSTKILNPKQLFCLLCRAQPM